MAPSPTGFLHIGTARTALFNWLYARRSGGVFILRIEDTDVERSKKEYEIELLKALHWLGIEWDEGSDIKDGELISKGDFGPYRQSERDDIYKKYLEKLIAAGRAYYCFCAKDELDVQRQAFEAQGLPPVYSGHCRDLKEPPSGRWPQVIRFKTPGVKIEFEDLIRRKVTFDANLFGDFVIAKTLTSPLYNFAVVVDDELMEISHVIRGEDHLSNTPKQILLQRALGFKEPQYAHVPLILDSARAKLSKRSNLASFMNYQKQGYLPGAMMNFMALLGWHPKDDLELMAPGELIEKFDLEDVQKSGAVFNIEKLNWLNKEHLKKMPPSEVSARLMPYLREAGVSADPEFVEKIVKLQMGRFKTLSEFVPSSNFFFRLPNYEKELLIWNDDTAEKTKSILEKAYVLISELDRDQLKREKVEKMLSELAKTESKGSVSWPIRVAVSGQKASPDPLEIIEIIGKHETIERLQKAISLLS